MNSKKELSSFVEKKKKELQDTATKSTVLERNIASKRRELLKLAEQREELNDKIKSVSGEIERLMIEQEGLYADLAGKRRKKVDVGESANYGD